MQLPPSSIQDEPLATPNKGPGTHPQCFPSAIMRDQLEKRIKAQHVHTPISINQRWKIKINQKPLWCVWIVMSSKLSMKLDNCCWWFWSIPHPPAQLSQCQQAPSLTVFTRPQPTSFFYLFLLFCCLFLFHCSTNIFRLSSLNVSWDAVLFWSGTVMSSGPVAALHYHIRACDEALTSSWSCSGSVWTCLDFYSKTAHLSSESQEDMNSHTLVQLSRVWILKDLSAEMPSRRFTRTHTHGDYREDGQRQEGFV